MDDHNRFYQFFDNGMLRVALTGALSILALFLLAETIAIASDFGRPGNPATDTITVNGQGQASLPPDIARISFTVENRAPAVSDAQSATTKQANAAIEFVKKQGTEEKDIRTLAYNISPQYSYGVRCEGGYCPGEPKVIGYIVSETVEVKVRDLEKVGELLAGLGKLEVQNLNGPSFALDDATAGYDAARADAIASAKAQADVLARQLGVRLGKIVNFSESSGGVPYPMLYGMGAGGDLKASVPNVPTGENTYNASVSITYEIR